MRILRRRWVWLSLLLVAGCAGGGHPPGVVMPLSSIGVNLGIDDLVGQPDIEQRVAVSLTRIAAKGYAHEVRMVMNRDWGPQLIEHALPVLRAEGFKLLPILSSGNQVGPYNTAADLAWLEHALPLMADVLVGVQLSNEPWQSKIDNNKLTPFPPYEFAKWHRALTPTVRRLAPVPIVDGDVDGGWGEAKRWWTEVEASGGIDIDALSWHVYNEQIPPTYGHRVWITEAGSILDCVAPAIKCFVFTW